ncbi:hypothetical protein PO124_07625 [Bacillus licheniformis]|nr:hypothetical protein [Bacillus licheniformis]
MTATRPKHWCHTVSVVAKRKLFSESAVCRSCIIDENVYLSVLLQLFGNEEIDCSFVTSSSATAIDDSIDSSAIRFRRASAFLDGAPLRLRNECLRV